MDLNLFEPILFPLKKRALTPYMYQLQPICHLLTRIHNKHD